MNNKELIILCIKKRWEVDTVEWSFYNDQSELNIFISELIDEIAQLEEAVSLAMRKVWTGIDQNWKDRLWAINKYQLKSPVSFNWFGTIGELIADESERGKGIRWRFWEEKGVVKNDEYNGIVPEIPNSMLQEFLDFLKQVNCDECPRSTAFTVIQDNNIYRILKNGEQFYTPGGNPFVTENHELAPMICDDLNHAAANPWKEIYSYHRFHIRYLDYGLKRAKSEIIKQILGLYNSYDDIGLRACSEFAQQINQTPTDPDTNDIARDPKEYFGAPTDFNTIRDWLESSSIKNLVAVYEIGSRFNTILSSYRHSLWPQYPMETYYEGLIIYGSQYGIPFYQNRDTVGLSLKILDYFSIAGMYGSYPDEFIVGESDESKQITVRINEEITHKNFQKALELLGGLGNNLTFQNWYQKGVCHHNLNQISEAIEAYSTCLGIGPTYYKALGNRGICLFCRNKIDDALQDFRNALAQNPHLGLVWDYIGFYYVREFNQKNTKVNNALIKARAAYDRAIKSTHYIGSSEIEISSVTTKISDFIGDDKELSGISIDDILSPTKILIIPETPIIKRKGTTTDSEQIDSEIKKGNYERALEIIAELDNNLTPDIWFQKGVCLYKLNRNREAIDAYSKCMQITPKHFQAIANRGICHLELNNTFEAFTDFRNALSLNPNIGPVWLHIGQFYVQQAISNNFEIEGAMLKGRAAYKKALELMPDIDTQRVYLPWEGAMLVSYFINYGDDISQITIDDILSPSKKVSTLVKPKPTQTASKKEENVEQSIKIISDLPDKICSLCITPDDKYIIAGGNNGNICLIDIDESKLVHTFKGHDVTVSDITYSSKHNTVITASEDGTICFWNFDTWRHIKDESHHDGPIYTICPTPDESTVFSGHFDGKINIWSLPEGQCIESFQASDYMIRSLNFHPDGKHFIFGSIPNIYLAVWEKTCQIIGQVKEDPLPVFNLCFCPDGKHFISDGSHEYLSYWDFETRKQIRKLEGLDSGIASLSIHPNGRIAASGGGIDNSCRVWDIDSGKCISKLMGHTEFVHVIRFSPSGKYLLSGAWDRTIRFWEVPDVT